MHRRTVLALGASVALAGCLGEGIGTTPGTTRTSATATNTTQTTERTYSECPLQIISYSAFPGPIREEIDVALAEGSYAADRILLAEAMDETEGYVRYEQTHYRPHVEREGERSVLTLTPDDDPELREARTLELENETGQTVEPSVRITSETETLFSERVSLRSGAVRPVFATKKMGHYDVEIKLDGRTETVGWNVGQSYFDMVVQCSKIGFETKQAVRDLPSCFLDTTSS
ncbi:hypothetical protein [Haladaptatus sp. NG-WS-4]